MITKFSQFNEKLSIKTYRKYHKVFNRERYEDLFQEYKNKYDGDRNAFRIFIPLVKSDSSAIQLEVEDVLSGLGYDISKNNFNYVEGKVRFAGAKNMSPIGKVLTKNKYLELADKFASDPTRAKGNDGIVCISRHAYDIAGSDTDRRWHNCMTLKHYNQFLKDTLKQHDNSKYLLQDVKQGSLIAYLIREDDRNIEDPLGNINIKPYLNEENPDDFLLVPDVKQYGIFNKNFQNTVLNWCKEVNGEKIGHYKLKKGLYSDSIKSIAEESRRKKMVAKGLWKDDPYRDIAIDYLPPKEREKALKKLNKKKKEG